MIVRIMRHGDAPFINGERQLSELGRAEARLMARWLKDQSSSDLVLVSPLLRAQQTADEVFSVIPQEFPKLEESLLKPESDPKLSCEYFEALGQKSVLLISHMPLVVNLMETWLPSQGRYFPTASIAEIELFQNKPNTLRQFITPADL